MVETRCGADALLLATDRDEKPREIPVEKIPMITCLDAFLNDIRGDADEAALTTPAVLRASPQALLAQRAADEGLSRVMCG